MSQASLLVFDRLNALFAVLDKAAAMLREKIDPAVLLAGGWRPICSRRQTGGVRSPKWCGVAGWRRAAEIRGQRFTIDPPK
jgi:hypothetical protein